MLALCNHSTPTLSVIASRWRGVLWAVKTTQSLHVRLQSLHTMDDSHLKDIYFIRTQILPCFCVQNFEIKRHPGCPNVSSSLCDPTGIQNGLLSQEPHRAGKASLQERRGDPRDRVRRDTGGQRVGSAEPLQVDGPEAAEREDPVAELAQQLLEGQRARAFTQWGYQPQDQNHSVLNFYIPIFICFLQKADGCNSSVLACPLVETLINATLRSCILSLYLICSFFSG